LYVQEHLIPDPQQVLEHRHGSDDKPFDLFDDSLFSTPEGIGDYQCGGS
jgi:hypothetical protein